MRAGLRTRAVRSPVFRIVTNRAAHCLTPERPQEQHAARTASAVPSRDGVAGEILGSAQVPRADDAGIRLAEIDVVEIDLNEAGLLGLTGPFRLVVESIARTHLGAKPGLSANTIDAALRARDR